MKLPPTPDKVRPDNVHPEHARLDKPRPPKVTLRYWWQRLLHNAPQKLLALLLATVAWFFATEDRRANVQQNYDVAVEVRDTTGGSEKRAASGLNPGSVRVTLSGPRQRLGNLNASDISAYIDVTDLPEGSFNRNVRVIGPDGTRSIQVTPAVIAGRLDAEQSRTQPVTLSISASSQNSLPRYVLAPAQVTISGPSRLVGSVVRVITEPVSLSSGDQREAKLLALDAQANVVGVKLSPASVTASRIDSGAVPIRNLTVLLPPPPAGLKVTASSIEPSSVRVIGPAGVISGLSSATVNLTYRLGSYSVQPLLRLPAGVSALDKVTVQLTVTRQ